MARIPRSTQLRHISKSCKFKYSMDNSNQNNKQDKNLKYTKFHSLILAYSHTYTHRFELNAPKHNEIQRCSLWHSVLHHLLTLDLKKNPSNARISLLRYLVFVTHSHCGMTSLKNRRITANHINQVARKMKHLHSFVLHMYDADLFRDSWYFCIKTWTK